MENYCQEAQDFTGLSKVKNIFINGIYTCKHYHFDLCFSYIEGFPKIGNIFEQLPNI